ncbi:hypothetical protein ABEB36_005308 [Hypothenemus hampei]|uniref:Glutathione S-transferase 1 n=1 Tax=Hypothenemus hampei TaxID=57062 RepID=A0ABD1EXS9_HYPHA
MYSSHIQVKKNKQEKTSNRKEKKLINLIDPGSGSEGESEHELSYYIEDRVKLMKEILKIMNPKKIKSMAPECMKNMDLKEINSILLEELLGISNKRLKYIFEGKTLEEESSTDEDQPVDVISLDDVSDDDFVVISDDDETDQKKKHKRKKIKSEGKGKSKKIKKEHQDKDKKKEKARIMEKIGRGEKVSVKEKETIGEENLMSVLELLELQARARAIKSQLELESRRKHEEQKKLEETKENGQGDDDDNNDDDEVIIEVPQNSEIVITSSDSENEEKSNKIINTSESNRTNSINQINDESVTNDKVEKENEKKETLNKDSEIIANCPPKDANSDTDSNSNDNLRVIQERLKRKTHKNEKQSSKFQGNKSQAEPDETTEDDNEKMILNEPLTNDTENIEQTKGEPNKLNDVIEEFIKTNPVAEKSGESKESEEQEKQKVKELKQSKEKRLKNLRNKLQSYKQDVAVETSDKHVNVLKNIVIQEKQPQVTLRNKQMDESDDLVINVDQEDLDCIIFCLQTIPILNKCLLHRTKSPRFAGRFQLTAIGVLFESRTFQVLNDLICITMTIDLYYLPGSAPCRAVLLTAKALDLELNLKLTDLMAGEHLTPEFVKLNPQHTIPTLSDNGFNLWESRAIITYLVNQYGKDDSLYPKDPKKRALVDQRLYFDIGTLYARFADYYYPVIFGSDTYKPDKLEKINDGMKFLDTFLEGNKYVAGDNLTVADLSIVATISTYEAVDYDLSPYKNITRWYANLKATVPGYKEANQKGLDDFKALVANLSKK